MITKIFIDSRHSTGPANDFTVTLPESLAFPKKTIARVAEACIPNSWYLVDENNDGLFVVRQNVDGNIVVDRASLAQQHMNSAAQLATAIETALRSILGPSVSTIYSEEHNTIVITSSQLFYIPTQDQLHKFATDGSISSNFRSCNYLLENLSGSGNVPLTSSSSLLDYQWTSPGVDINRYHSVFIHSSLADNQTVSCNMQRTNVLKKVAVTAASGGKIFDSLSTSHDYCDVSEMNVRSLNFSLRDRDGNLINLQDHSWSLSIVFDYI